MVVSEWCVPTEPIEGYTWQCILVVASNAQPEWPMLSRSVIHSVYPMYSIEKLFNQASSGILIQDASWTV